MDEEIVTIKVTNNSIRLHPYTLAKYDKKQERVIGTCQALDRMFSNFDQYRKRYKIKIEIYDKTTKTLCLPRGVGLKNITDVLDKHFVVYNIIEDTQLPYEPREVDLSLKENLQIRDKSQAEGIEFLTNDTIGTIKMLSLYTGRGKTFCAISAMFRIKLACLIVSPTLSDQWIEKISEYTYCTIDNGGICVIRGTDALRRFLKKPKRKLTHVFYISTSTTLFNYVKKYGSLNDIGEHLGIGVKCFDEIHMFYSQNICVDSHMDTKFTFYLTATPERTGFDEKRIFNNLFKEVPVYGLYTKYENQYQILRLIDYDTQPNPYDIDTCYTSKGLSGVMYWNYIFRYPEKKMYLIGIIKILIDQLLSEDDDMKILIYLAKKDHIKEFKDIFESLYSNQNLKVGNYTTMVDKKVKRREISKNIIFTTILSGSVGLDVDNLRATFSLVPFSSSITSSQMLGRTRFIKDKPVYHYDFIDLGFPGMKYQRQMRMSVFTTRIKKIFKKTLLMDEVLKYIRDT